MDTFLHVGKNNLNSFTFRPIQDGILTTGELTKPYGGLWLTYQAKENKTGNEWIEFLSWHPNILIYGHYLNPDATMKCLLVKLKDTRKIFILDNQTKLNFLMQNYPSSNLFSYEKLSQDDDGIYLNISQFYHYPIYNQYFSKFAVNTLLLFNYNCIDYYYPGEIIIEDLNEFYEFNYYQINIKDLKKEINAIPLAYITFQKQVANSLLSYLQEKNYSKLSDLYFELEQIINNLYSKEINTFAQEAKVSNKKLTLSLINNILTNFK